MSSLLDRPAPPAGLPADAELTRVVFAAERPPGAAVVAELPAAVGRWAVAADGPAGADDELLVLSVPGPVDEDAEAVARARVWADAAAPADAPAQVVTLHGAQVVWARGRVAVFAPPDRLPAARRAAVEAAFYDAELARVERDLAALWPDLEADAPLAFEFDERSVRGRRRLADRFRRVLALRARLARIAPHIHAPFAHPPTLAGQVGERLRERARMAHRAESLGDQLEVFERVYDGCGQKASDFVLARTGHTLEWVIIILLLAQTLMVGFDLLAAPRR